MVKDNPEKMKKLLTIAVLLWGLPLLAQSNTGELRFSITDSAGLGLKSTVELVSEGNEYRQSLTTDDAGRLDVKRLPYGIYQIHIETKGFEAVSQSVEIHSALPADLVFKLKPSKVTTSVTVSESGTLIDPHRAGSVNQIGSETIQDRVTSLPGRSLAGPGEHRSPAGSTKATPCSTRADRNIRRSLWWTGFRSSTTARRASARRLKPTMSIPCRFIPRVFRRNLAGRWAVSSRSIRCGQAEPGFSGQISLTGGSFDTAGSYSQLQYSWRQNTLGVSGHGEHDGHYLNPVVPRELHQPGHHRQALRGATSAN